MSASRVEIVVPRGRLLRWQARLYEKLQQLLPDSFISLRLDMRADEWPEGVASLLGLERLLLRSSQPLLTDTLDPCSAPFVSTAAPADVVIDLCGDLAPRKGERVVRVTYDDGASDAFAVEALLAGRAPRLAIVDVGAATQIAIGLPSLEAADGLVGGLEAVYSRAATLVERVLLSPPEQIGITAKPVNLTPKSPAAFALRNLTFRCARALYHLCCRSPHWRVGWRFVDGPGLLDGATLSNAPWRIMQDRELSFAADPFPVEWRGNRGVFFERLDYRTNKGAIFFQPFDNTGAIGAPVRALEEAWHLSYPFLLEHKNELYMLPEALRSGALTLYRCIQFPHRWERVTRLLENIEVADATIFRHESRFWMTSVVRDGFGGYSDTLAIYYADDLFGPWTQHAQRPALVDSRFARPAGAVVRHAGQLLRPVQDSSKGYGTGVHIMRIDALTPEAYTQTPIRHITPGVGWPGSRLHTVNRACGIECIDGAIFSPKSRALRRSVNFAYDMFTHRAARTAQEMLPPKTLNLERQYVKSPD